MMSEKQRRAKNWIAKHHMPYVCVFSSEITRQRMMDGNGISPAEFLRPFGEVGNLNNYSVKTVEKNQPYKLKKFRINFIDSQNMQDLDKKSTNILNRILQENKPRIKSDITKDMPKTKEEINSRLLSLIGRDRQDTERTQTPWFTQLKKQFYE